MMIMKLIYVENGPSYMVGGAFSIFCHAFNFSRRNLNDLR